MAVIDPPPAPHIAADVSFGPTWYGWLTQAFRILFAAQQSGITENRPIKNRWVGMPYFDTTLGYEIWWNGSNWVNASGATV